MLLDLVADD